MGFPMTPQQQQMQAALYQEWVRRQNMMKSYMQASPAGMRGPTFTQSTGVSSFRLQNGPARRQRSASPEEPPTPPDEFGSISDSDDVSNDDDDEDGSAFLDDDDWRPGMKRKRKVGGNVCQSF